MTDSLSGFFPAPGGPVLHEPDRSGYFGKGEAVGITYRLRRNRWDGLDVSTEFGVVRTRRQQGDWILRRLGPNESLAWSAIFSEETPLAVRLAARAVALGEIRISGLYIPDGLW